MFEEKKDTVKVDISWKLLLKVAGFILAGIFLFMMRDIVGMLLVSLLLTTTITPFVDYVHKKKKLPRSLGILIVYIGIIAVFGLVVGLLFPAIIKEFRLFLDKIPAIYDSIASKIPVLAEQSTQTSIVELIKNSFSKLQESGGVIFKSFTGIVSGFGFLLMTLVITFYMTLEEDGPARLIKSLVPKKFHHYALNLLMKIQHVVGSWIKAQLALGLIIGTLCYIALIILGVNYALLLALVAAITELIPYIGPIIGAIPAVLLAFTQSPVRGLFVIIVYVLIQQLENHFIVPKLMNKSVGLNPIVVIIVIIIGAKLGGIAGAMIAVPLAAIIQVFVSEFFHLEQDGIFTRKINIEERKED